MNNELKQFLKEERERFTTTANTTLKQHDEIVVNFVLDLVKKEVNKPEVASGVMLDQRGRKWVEVKDISTIIDNLKVK